MNMLTRVAAAACIATILGSGCATPPRRPVTLAPHVDIPRFMGDWYVLASIPLWPEREAFNGIESYQLDGEGRILTTYTFRKGGFDGPVKTYKPVGRVYNKGTGSEWKMQFLWPFEADYLIHYVSPDYRHTIVGEPGLDYVWIMSRESSPGEPVYEELVRLAGEMGYDVSKMRRVPQKWPDGGDAPGEDSP